MKNVIIGSVKSVAMMLLAFPLTAFGKALSVPTLPPSEYADTEVSTNIPICVNLERLDRMRFVLELSPSATNDVEILIGHDADTNGVLSVEESRIAFGYDCGSWFERRMENVEWRIENGGEGVANGRVRRELAIRYKDFAPDWDLVKVVRRGLSAADESVALVEERKRFILFVR